VESIWHTILRHASRFSIGSLAPVVVAFLAAPVFARILSPGDWGRYSLSVTAAVVSGRLLGGWIEQGISRFLPGAKDTDAKQLRAVSIVAALCIGLLIVVLAVAISGFILEHRLLVVMTGGLAAAQILMQAVLAILRSDHRSGIFAALTAGAAIGAFGIGVVGALTLVDAGLGRVVGQAAGTAAMAVVGIVVIRSALDAQIWKASTARPLIMRSIRYGAPMTMWLVAADIMSAGDRWIIAALSDADSVGVYSANYQLAAAGTLVLFTPFMLALTPTLMSTWDSGNAPVVRSLLRTSARYGLHLTALLTVLAAILGQLASETVLGADYLPPPGVIPAVVAGSGMWQVGHYLQKPLEFRAKTFILAGLGLACALVNVGLNLALIPKMGIVGAAVATATAFWLYALACAIIGARAFSWPVPWSTIGAATAVIATALAYSI
jgi:O-antigen/teichoic acid export membrane protein